MPGCSLVHQKAYLCIMISGFMVKWFSSQQYDPRAEMALSMKVEDVIQMMNERIRFIGGRGLKQYEREFLRERLSMIIFLLYVCL